MKDVKPLERIEFAAGALMRDHPPVWNCRNKSVVFEISNSSGAPHEGRIVYARWPAQKPPSKIESRSGFMVRKGFFEYARPARPATVEWHLNFADPELFGYYDSGLFAQDELQVAEHPALGSLREALVSVGKTARTVDGKGKPTPVTVTGVQRRCAIDTFPDLAAGRPSGLYGNAFAAAPEEQVRAATRAIIPPSVSNILALAAPSYGNGAYKRREIVRILTTAYTGFSAARRESGRIAPRGPRTVIHTGFWGCGAFGGNRRLMTVLQALAADLAGADIVFWAVDDAGVKSAEGAYAWYRQLREKMTSVPHLLDHLVQEKLEWGESDGN